MEKYFEMPLRKLTIMSSSYYLYRLYNTLPGFYVSEDLWIDKL